MRKLDGGYQHRLWKRAGRVGCVTIEPRCRETHSERMTRVKASRSEVPYVSIPYTLCICGGPSILGLWVRQTPDQPVEISPVSLLALHGAQVSDVGEEV
jgi:hypothetical protein